MNKNYISAIIWDFDSTLADTKLKNMNVTKQIIKKVTGKEPNQFSIFESLEKYFYYNTRTNWRIFYANVFSMTEFEIDEAGRLWTEYQQRDITEIKLYSGIVDIVKEFGEIPHGIFSMNSKGVIKNVLKKHNILEHFYSVVGYEEVGVNQKPKPDGLLMCINEIGIDSGIIFYIGDMECDSQCVVNVNKILKDDGKKLRIINICSKYDSVQELRSWSVKPDYIAVNVNEVKEIIRDFYEDYRFKK